MITIFDTIESKIISTQNSVSRNMKNWYERTGSIVSYIDTSLEVNSYPNYSIYKFTNINPDPDEEYDFDGQQDIYVNGKRVSSTTNLVAKIQYYYDANGNVQSVVDENGTLVNYPQNNQTEGNIIVPADAAMMYMDYAFNLNIVSNSTEDKPIPVYTEEDLINMQAGADYILLNDKNAPLILENWLPLTTAIKSLDGNDRVIIIKSFAPNATEGTFNFGLFGTVNPITVLKKYKNRCKRFSRCWRSN